MLSDIEKRKKQEDPKKSDFLSDLIAPKKDQENAGNIKKSKRTVIIVIISIAVVLLFALSFRLPEKKTEIKQKLAVIEKATVPVINSGAQPLATKPAVTPPVANNYLVELKKILVEQEDGKTDLILSFADTVHYHLDMDKAHAQVVLTIEDSQTIQQLPDISQLKTAIKTLEMKVQDDDIRFMLQLKPNTKIQSTQFNKETKELVITFGLEPIVVSATSGQMEGKPQFMKQDIPLTPKQKAARTYDQALRLLSTNQYQEAKAKLTELLATMPTYSPARQTLIVILMQQREYTNANRLIDEGLQNNPTDLELIKLKARWFVLQQQPGSALKLLQNNAPKMADNPEYFSMMAALQEQLGRPEVAAQIYQGLVNINANQAEWWAGLGIALEKMGQTNDAVDAYQRAVSIGNMNSNIQTYVDMRLHQLTGQ
jgi:tetratricopeptide (TPR) repeat protein